MKKLFVLFILQFGFILANGQKVDTRLTYSVQHTQPIAAKSPVLVLLHGYGSNENDLMQMTNKFDPRFLIFSLRAPYKIKEGGNSWYDVEFLSDSNIKYNYEQVIKTREEIMSFIKSACQVYNADTNQVFVLGFSQGAIMGYDLALSSPDKIKGLVALSGRMIDETQKIEADWNKVSKLKIFIAHGSSDKVIKIADSEKANAYLQGKKVADLTFKKYDMPHAIKGVEVNDIAAWLRKQLPGQRTDSKKK